MGQTVSWIQVGYKTIRLVQVVQKHG